MAEVVVRVDVLVFVDVGVVTELDDDPPGFPAFEAVEPMSPHLMLEKTTWVSGCCARMLDGLPSVLEQGPLLPLSSQFMKPPLSFQTLKVSTMPRFRAWPMVVSPP